MEIMIITEIKKWIMDFYGDNRSLVRVVGKD